MTISEPMTLATDYLLGAVTAWLGIRLFRHARDQNCQKLWALAFAALALAAFLGGTWHGLWRDGMLWKATVLSVGVASFGMVAGSAHATLTGAARNIVIWIALGKLLAYFDWMLRDDEFIYVVVDTGIAFAVLLFLHLWKLDGWLVAGVAVSVLAGLAQASGFAPHARFNHNDLYHVIQTAAMWLLYRGARVLSDATDPTPAPPAAGARP